MAQQSADVPERHLTQASIIIAGEQRFTATPQALMGVHPAAVIAKQGLRHKRDRLTVLIGHIADDIFVNHHVVRGFHERVELLVNFTLAAGSHFVVMTLNGEAAFNHRGHHFTP